MSDQFFILVPLLPEESIYSWFGRSSVVSGAPTLNYLWRMCTGANSYPAIVFPTGLDRLSDALGIADRNVLPLAHTPLLAHRAFVNSRVYAEAWSTMRENPKSRGGVATKLPTKHSRSEVRFCEECVIDDIKQYGAAYIHRHHCMQGVYVCVAHGNLLTSGCGQCSTSGHGTNRVRHLSTICECGNRLSPCIGSVTKKETDILYRLSRHIDDFLRILGPASVTHNQIAKAYREALESSVLEKTKPLADFVRERLGENLMRLMNIQIRGHLPMAASLYGAGVPVSSLVINSIIVDEFFGTVERLLDTANQFDRVASDKMINLCRKRLSELVDTGQVTCAQDFSKRLPKEYEIIKRVDRYWIEKILGATHESVKRDFLKVDRNLITYMRKSLQKMLDSAQRPVKITRARLIWRYPGAKHLIEFLDQLPRSARFIKRNVDTPERYLCKVVIYLMLVDRDSSFTPEQKVKRLSVPVSVAKTLAAHGLPRRGREPAAIKNIIATRSRLQSNRRKLGLFPPETGNICA